MKAWHNVGYADTAAGCVYCVGCAQIHALGPDEAENLQPIFATDEDWESDVCDDCGCSLEETL